MDDDQQFCLRWNNHQSTLIQNFDTLLESGTLVDCTLAAEGKYLKAHKVVLSACSPYFEGLLSEHYDKHPVFILKDVKFKELKAMMDYMYRGEVNISQDQLTALLKAAESLQIKGLSDNRTGGTGTSTSKTESTRSAKTASSTVAGATSSVASVDIPHASSSLTIEKNSSKVPRQSLQQVPVSDLTEDSASPQLRGLSSREGSQSPTGRKRKRARRRSLGNDDNNTMDNHEASNSSDAAASAPALGVAPVGDERSHAESADPISRSALMQQLTKPADEMLQIPVEKPEPSEEMIQPKSEFLDDQDNVEDLTNLDDDMNDLDEMEDSRAGPSHDPSQHHGMATWHMAGDRSNSGVVGAAGGPGAQDEVFLAAHEAAQAQRDSQDLREFLASSYLAVTLPSLSPQRVVLVEDHEEIDPLDGEQYPVEVQRKTGPKSRPTVKSKRFKRKFMINRAQLKKQNTRQTKASSASSKAKPEVIETKRTNRNTKKTVVKKETSIVETEMGPFLMCPNEGCKRIFTKKDTLYRHIKYHCGVEPRFACGLCEYKAPRSHNVYKHFDRKHPGCTYMVLDTVDQNKLFQTAKRSRKRNSFVRQESDATDFL